MTGAGARIASTGQPVNRTTGAARECDPTGCRRPRLGPNPARTSVCLFEGKLKKRNLAGTGPRAKPDTAGHALPGGGKAPAAHLACRPVCKGPKWGPVLRDVNKTGGEQARLHYLTPSSTDLTRLSALPACQTAGLHVRQWRPPKDVTLTFLFRRSRLFTGAPRVRRQRGSCV